ncbi:MAG: hypothetical protein WBN94_12810 [Methanothrix sp.]
MSMVGEGLIKTESLLNEADTCRKYVEPGLVRAGWDDEPHSFTGQQNFTDGRIFVIGDKPKRKSRKRADYLLRYTRDFKLNALKRHQTETAAELDALLPAVLERAFRGEL